MTGRLAKLGLMGLLAVSGCSGLGDLGGGSGSSGGGDSDSGSRISYDGQVKSEGMKREARAIADRLMVSEDAFDIFEAGNMYLSIGDSGSAKGCMRKLYEKKSFGYGKVLLDKIDVYEVKREPKPSN